MGKINTVDFEECDWDAANELVASGWTREAAIIAVRDTIDAEYDSDEESEYVE